MASALVRVVVGLALALGLGGGGCSPGPAPAEQPPPERTAAPVTVSPAPPVLHGEVVSLQRVAQGTSSWCWVATTEMALRHVRGRRARSACGRDGIVYPTWVDEAGKDFAEKCLAICQACGDPDESLEDCVSTGWPQLAANGVLADITPVEKQRSAEAALPWEDLKAQFRQRGDAPASPVIFAWRWTGGGGHLAVATGFAEDAAAGEDGRLVLVQDPWPPCNGDTYFMSYAAWVGSEAVGRVHWLEYWNLRPAEGSGAAEHDGTPASAHDVGPATETAPMRPMVPFTPSLAPGATGPPSVPGDALDTARRGLELLKTVVRDARTAEQLGFRSHGALASAELGQPIWEARVRLDALRKHDPAAALETLLDGDGWIFPVVQRGGGAVLTAVEVDRASTSWRVSELGGQQWVERIAKALAAAARQDPPWPRELVFMVSVPALRNYYLALRDASGTLMVAEIPSALAVPLRDPVPATEALRDLQAEAREHDADEPG